MKKKWFFEEKNLDLCLLKKTKYFDLKIYQICFLRTEKKWFLICKRSSLFCDIKKNIYIYIYQICVFKKKNQICFYICKKNIKKNSSEEDFIYEINLCYVHKIKQTQPFMILFFFFSISAMLKKIISTSNENVDQFLI